MGVPRIVLIYARAADGTIGQQGTMPWHLPADLKRFKQLTMGHPMIMGRRTYDSFGRPLPGRRHIVLSRDPDWSGPQAEVVRSASEALATAMEGNPTGHVCVVGGAEIYRLFMPRTTHVELTAIHADYDGDTHMPALGAEWVEVARESHPATDGRPAYDYVSYERAQ